jgi:DNA-binding transcriptional LysR family regulator
MISASPRRLSVFKSVVDCGGFNLAAAEIGIAQPSVGAHIKALEAQVGHPLFQRSRGRRPQLTKAGEALYAYAVEILHQSQLTSQTLAAIRSSAHQELVIAVSRCLAPYFLPVRLNAFRADHPRIRVVTRIGTTDDVIAQVRTRSVHLGIFFASGPFSGLRSAVIEKLPLVLVVSPNHPLAGHKKLPAAVLKQYPFITGISGSLFNKMADAALATIGIRSYEVAMELEESAAAKEVVRHGTGIAYLPRCTVTAELSSGSLVELTPKMPMPALEVRYGYVGSVPDSARDFLHYLAPKGASSPLP